MIVVTGRVQIPAERREDFIEVATEMCRHSREEVGCAGYNVYADLEQPDRYVFLEEWVDDAAVQRHFVSPTRTHSWPIYAVCLESRRTPCSTPSSPRGDWIPLVALSPSTEE